MPAAATAVAAALAPLAFVLAVLPAGVAGRLGAPGLCAAEVVSETCALLDASGGGRATPEALQEIFDATEASIEAFWMGAGLGRERGASSASCAELCASTTALLKSLGRRLPPRSDLACYEGDSGTTLCDLDLGADAIHATAASIPDVPPYAGEPEPHMSPAADAETPVPTVDYSVEELAVRIAQLFRIYPALDSQVRMEKSAGDGVMLVHEKVLARRLRQSQAYLNIALRTFASNRTRHATRLFFGEQALTLRRSRLKIVMVLNSVNNVISNATYVYPGPRCSGRTVAYVFPCQGATFEKDPLGRYIVHLCDLFFTSSSIQIATLIHEAAHHATACTVDVKYGERECIELAHSSPMDAMRNADNYGYFIRRIAGSYGTF